jgi:hypothetical protein
MTAAMTTIGEPALQRLDCGDAVLSVAPSRSHRSFSIPANPQSERTAAVYSFGRRVDSLTYFSTSCRRVGCFGRHE